MRKIKNKRSIVSLVTLVAFMFTNYSSVFAAVNVTTEESTQMLQDFKDEYLQLNSSFGEFYEVVAKDAVQAVPEEGTDEVEAITEENNLGYIGEIELLLTNDVFPLTKEGIKQYSVLKGDNLVLPTFDANNVYNRAYLLFTPSTTMQKIKVEYAEGKVETFTNNFIAGKRYLLDVQVTGASKVKISDFNNATNMVEKDIVKEDANEVKDSINAIVSKVDNNSITLEWKENNTVEKPNSKTYSSSKIKFSKNSDLKTEGYKFAKNGDTYQMVLKRSNFSNDYHSGYIFTIDNLGRVVTGLFSFMNSANTSIDILGEVNGQAVDLTNNKTLEIIDGGKVTLNVDATNNSNFKAINSIPNGVFDKNTLYYTVTKDGVNIPAVVTESSLANGKRFSLNFVADISLRSAEQIISPGNYEVKLIATGEYDSDKKEQVVNINVRSDRPVVSVDKVDAVNDTLRLIENYNGNGVSVKFTNNNTDLTANTDKSKLNFNLRLPSDDKLKTFCAVLKNETTNKEYHIALGDYDKHIGCPTDTRSLNQAINLYETGKYSLIVKNIETNLGFTLNNTLFASQQGNKYSFIFDNEKPQAKLVVLNEADNNVVGDYNGNYINSTQVLGLQVSDFDFDSDNAIKSLTVINKKSNTAVSDAKFEKVAEGLYKLTVTDDGEYSLRATVKDNSNNISDAITASNLVIDKSKISSDNVKLTPYKVVNGSISGVLPTSQAGLYHYKDDFITRIELPFKYSGYEKVTVSIDTSKAIIENYAVSKDPTNGYLNISNITLSGSELDRLQTNGYLNLNISKYLDIKYLNKAGEGGKANFDKYADLTDNTFTVTVKVKANNSSAVATSKYTLNLDALAPVIYPQASVSPQDENGFKHYIVKDNKLNLMISNGDGSEELEPNTFKINYNDKNLKSYSLTIKNNEGLDEVVPIKNSTDFSYLNMNRPLRANSWYMVELSIKDINDNETSVKYKITLDNKGPEMQFVLLDKNKVNSNGQFDINDLGNAFVFNGSYKTSDSELIGVLVKDLDIKEDSRSIEMFVNGNKITASLEELNLNTRGLSDGEARLYLIKVNENDCIDGTYSISAKISDIAENKSELKTNEFIIDNILPTIDLAFKKVDGYPSFALSNKEAYVGTQGDFIVTSTLSETESGYKDINYKIMAGNNEIWSDTDNITFDYENHNAIINKQIPITKECSALLNNNKGEVQLKLVITATSNSGSKSNKDVVVIYDTKAPRISLNETKNSDFISDEMDNPSIFTQSKELEFKIVDKSFRDSLTSDLTIINEYNSLIIEEAKVLSYDKFKALNDTKSPYKQMDEFDNIDGLTFVKKQTISEGYTYTINKDNAPYEFVEGAYKLKLKAIDTAGNETSKEYYFIVDTSMPSISDVKVSKMNSNSSLFSDGTKYYINEGLKISFNINETISANKEMTLHLSSSNATLNVALNKYLAQCNTHKSEGEKLQAGEHSYSINISDIIKDEVKNHPEIAENQDIQARISLETKAGQTVYSDTINVVYDTTIDTATFKATSSESNNEPFNDNAIFASNKQVTFTYGDTFKIVDGLTLQNGNNPNSISVESVKRKVLGEKDFVEIFKNGSISEHEVKGLSVVGEITGKTFGFINGNDELYTFNNGIYIVSIKLIDACGNVSRQTINFTVDTDKVQINGNGQTKKFEGNSLSNKYFNIGDNSIEYTAKDSKLQLSFNNVLSGFNSISSIKVFKDGDESNNLFYDYVVRNELVGVSEYGEVINLNGDSELTSRKLSLYFPDKENGRTDIKYTVKVYLKSNAGSEADYNLDIICDYTNPNAALTVVNDTGRNGSLYYTNSDDRSIQYHTDENNIKNVVVSGADKVVESDNNDGAIFGDLLSVEKQYDINLNVVDKVGRVGRASVSIVYDITKPVITTMSASNFNSAEGVYYTNQVRPYDYTVTDTNLKSEQLTVNGNTIAKSSSISGDGNKDVLVYAEDYAGNKSTSEKFSFILDTVKPEITQEGIINERYYNKDVKSKISYTDTYLDKASYVATLNGNSYANEQVISKDGEYVLNYSVKDYAGNIGEGSVKFVIDKIAPVITITGIEEDKINGGIIKPEIEIDDPTATVTALLNGEEYTGEEIEGVGKYTLLVTAADKAGNVAKKSVTFMMDSEKPIITVEGLADGDVVEPGFKPVISVTKNAEIKLLLNGKEYKGDAIEKEGKYTLKIIATDSVGNENEEEIKFEVKKAAVALTEPSGNTSKFALVGAVVAVLAIGSIIFVVRRKKAN